MNKQGRIYYDMIRLNEVINRRFDSVEYELQTKITKDQYNFIKLSMMSKYLTLRIEKIAHRDHLEPMDLKIDGYILGHFQDMPDHSLFIYKKSNKSILYNIKKWLQIIVLSFQKLL